MSKTNTMPSSEEVREQIAQRAYFIAEQDGFAPGKDFEYWLAAEKEVLDAVLPVAKKSPAKPAVKPAPAAKKAPAAKAPAAKKAPAKVAAAKTPAKKAAKKA